MLNKGLQRYLPAEALQKLARAHIGIAGAGGLGSNCAMILVRSGIKSLTIADFDVVEPSNLNRQFFFPEDIGKPKVEALGEHLGRLAPDLKLALLNQRLSVENIPEIFAKCDVVVEALDNAEYKAALIGALAASPAMIVSASGLGGISGPPMLKRFIGKRLVCVGDFASAVDDTTPPLAPRVMQAAALEAEAVLEFLLNQL